MSKVVRWWYRDVLKMRGWESLGVYFFATLATFMLGGLAVIGSVLVVWAVFAAPMIGVPILLVTALIIGLSVFAKNLQ